MCTVNIELKLHKNIHIQNEPQCSGQMEGFVSAAFGYVKY